MKKIRVSNTSHAVGRPFELLSSIDFIDYQSGTILENARQLQENQLDVALISAADYALSGSYVALDFGVGCYAASRRLVLYGASDFAELRTVYISERSACFSIFLRILLKDRWNIAPRLILTEHEVQPLELQSTEGVLVFHEQPATFPIKSYAIAEDLVQAWYDWSGHPFVFFIWATRPEALSLKQHQMLNEIFYVCNKARETINQKASDNAGYPLAYLRSYLPESFLHYHLSDEMKAGIDFFIDLAAREKLLPKTVYHSATYKLGDRTTSKLPEGSSLTDLLLKAINGRRLSIREGVRLVEKTSLADLMMAADLYRQKLFSKHSLSYTSLQAVEGLLECDDPVEKVISLKKAGVGKLLLIPPYGKLEDPAPYERLLCSLKIENHLEIEGFGPPQVLELSRRSGCSLDEILSRLITAGLDYIAGWGGGLLIDHKIGKIDRNRVSVHDWLQVMYSAHRFGAGSSSFIHISPENSWEERLIHMHKLRSLQDITGGIRYFYILAEGEGISRLKTTMIAKLFLDNIPSIHEVNLDAQDLIGILGLSAGANEANLLFNDSSLPELQETREMLSILGERELELEVGPWRTAVPSSIN